MKIIRIIIGLLFFFLMQQVGAGQTNPQFSPRLDVSGNSFSAIEEQFSHDVAFLGGVDGKAIQLDSMCVTNGIQFQNENCHLLTNQCFTVRFWVKTTMDHDKPVVMVSQKLFSSKNLTSQKNAGWVFYINGGTWAWNMGSGDRRITHESERSQTMPINDGAWHQLAMTYDCERHQVRLFYDGVQRAVYNLRDDVGFDFSSESPLVVGSAGTGTDTMRELEQAIEDGAAKLQELVDSFHGLGIGELAPSQFASLIVDPQGLVQQTVGQSPGVGGVRRSEMAQGIDLAPVERARAELMTNPYTIHQVRDFMRVAPLLKLYALVDGRVTIDKAVADRFIENERLYPAEIAIDSLSIYDRALSQQEIARSYAAYFGTADESDLEEPVLKTALASITVANWNIHHGGKHYTVEADGWDSRDRIIEILEEEDADIVLLQETYSSGAFIANQLGYYYASTVDYDYLNQGSNISILSRYPIEAIDVPQEATFMNIGATITVSQTQKLYVMSNWYGMAQFPAVYGFHRERFASSDEIPVIFAGDFNAVPHTDGGKSMASEMLMEAGFTDAFREQYPSIGAHPGYTHDSNRRIDQLYYKGEGLKNTDTKIISTWPTGFPSDHSLIITKFDLINN